MFLIIKNHSKKFSFRDLKNHVSQNLFSWNWFSETFSDSFYSVQYKNASRIKENTQFAFYFYLHNSGIHKGSWKSTFTGVNFRLFCCLSGCHRSPCKHKQKVIRLIVLLYIWKSIKELIVHVSARVSLKKRPHNKDSFKNHGYYQQIQSTTSHTELESR